VALRLLLSGAVTSLAAAGQVFISEYGEGSANNKFIELCNDTPEPVDLGAYQIRLISNGKTDWSGATTIALVGELAAGAVFVACHPGAEALLLARANLTHGFLSFNGDDAVGLAYSNGAAWVVIDAVGRPLEDPGNGWAVAGVSNGTLDHVLVRKDAVVQGETNWLLSAGTDANDSQWIVHPADTLRGVGYHRTPPRQPPLIDVIPPGTARTVQVNSPIAFNVVVSDFNFDTVTNSSPNLPAGANLTANPLLGGAPLTNTFAWTPTTAGDLTVIFTAADGDGISTQSIDIHVSGCLPPAERVWINEIHYDNTGADTNEGVEVAGVAGLDLSHYRLIRYEGDNGTPENSALMLTGLTIDHEQAGYGAVWCGCPMNGLENGAPDGIALAEVCGGQTNVLQFLSYEGSFAATDGPARGFVSTDIGVSETGSEPVGQSLQLVGAGVGCADFTWTGPRAASPGQLNSGQILRPRASVFVAK